MIKTKESNENRTISFRDNARAQTLRNEKKKQTNIQNRGRIHYYYKGENKKIDLLNKMDKIKLCMAERHFIIKVSTFAVLHRVFDYFIDC